MAGLQVDEISVASRFDPSGFSAGLAESQREFQQFIQRTTTLSAPVVVDFKLTGVTQAAQHVGQVKASVAEGISPASFEAFSQATTRAFGDIATSIKSMEATLNASLGPMARFFEGLEQGAADAL